MLALCAVQPLAAQSVGETLLAQVLNNAGNFITGEPERSRTADVDGQHLQGGNTQQQQYVHVCQHMHALIKICPLMDMFTAMGGSSMCFLLRSLAATSRMYQESSECSKECCVADRPQADVDVLDCSARAQLLCFVWSACMHVNSAAGSNLVTTLVQPAVTADAQLPKCEQTYVLRAAGGFPQNWGKLTAEEQAVHPINMPIMQVRCPAVNQPP